MVGFKDVSLSLQRAQGKLQNVRCLANNGMLGGYTGKEQS